jgi:hypothetical protein
MNCILHKLLLSDQIRRKEMGGESSMKESKEVAYKISALNLKGGKPVWRSEIDINLRSIR